MADYRIVSYRPSYRSQIAELQNNLWGRNTELNAAYFDWKYLRNPYVKDPLVYLALYQEQVVGMRGLVGAEWEFGSPRQRQVLPLAADMVIAPNHRNRGLVTLLMKAALEDLAEKHYTYVVSMEARPATLLSQITTGWRQVGSLEPMERSVAPSRSFPGVRALLKKSPFVVRAYRSVRPRQIQKANRDAAGLFGSPKDQTLTRHVVMETLPRPEEMAELGDRLGPDARIRHVRDATYYAWRFQNPRSRYRFLFWRQRRMEGYLVLQAESSEAWESVRVIDWQASSDRVLAELFDSTVKMVRGRTLCIWSATMKENERRILEAAGFQRLNQATNPKAVTVRPVSDEVLSQEWVLGSQRLLTMANWDFRMIHSRAY